MPSKARFIAAQMEALITDKLWLENASQANSMTRSLLQVLLKFPRIHITHKCQANAIFATMPREYIDFLLEDFYFYVWDETSLLVRLMCSFNTEPQHIEAFAKRLSEAQQIFG
jgi:threonine aldolase